MLDNLEQLDGAGAVVAALLAAAPGLVVLATSRRPLHVQGEQEFPVPPLEVPGGADVAAVAACAAARLFAQQAGMVRPGFAITADNAADVAAICRRLDGLPLAIELAAARVKLLAPRALLARLGNSLGLAAAEAGRPLRQQTLRNIVAWSYDLLTPGAAAGVPPDERVRRGMRPGRAGRGGRDRRRSADPIRWTLVAELHDVSLITVTEGDRRRAAAGHARDDPRVRPRAARSKTTTLDGARRRHAEHYAASPNGPTIS